MSTVFPARLIVADHVGRHVAPISALRECDTCAVRSLSICSVLQESEHQRFEALGRNVALPARTVLFSEGAPADAIYNITGGAVRLYRMLPDGGRRIIGFGLPGDFLGIPLGECHDFSADTLRSPFAACRFPRAAFVRFMDERPPLLRRVLDATLRTLDLARNQTVLMGQPDARAKVAAFIITMRARWARLRTAATVPLPMGRQDIGDYLGLSIATVSRTLRRLEREGVIAIVSGGVRVRDSARLERLAKL